MGKKNIQHTLAMLCLGVGLGLNACQTSTTAIENTTEPESTETTRLSSARVDVRGSIIRNRYTQGQVFLEVEGPPSPDARFNRAVVQVLPTTQIIGPDGKSLGYSDLQQGQTISVLLQAGGSGTLQGAGIARKLWIEEF